MKKLILASASVHRISLLEQIGYKPDLIIPADIDEKEKQGESARVLAYRLAYEKALKVSKDYTDDIVLGADTVVAVGRTILPKALSIEDALYCLKKISGRRHRVYTGLCAIYQNKIIRRVALSIVKMKVISEQEKDLFIASQQWYGKAGGYSVQGFAASFIEQINGTESNIMGLPLCIAYKVLCSLGLKAKYFDMV